MAGEYGVVICNQVSGYFILKYSIDNTLNMHAWRIWSGNLYSCVRVLYLEIFSR